MKGSGFGTIWVTLAVVGCAQLLGADFDSAHPRSTGEGGTEATIGGAEGNPEQRGNEAGGGTAATQGGGDSLGGSTSGGSTSGGSTSGGSTSGQGGSTQVEGGAAGSNGQVLADGWITGPFGWKKGEDPRTMGKVEEVACGLTTIGGTFKAPEDIVQVTIAEADWVIDGGGTGEHLEAEGYCYRLDGFIKPDQSEAGTPSFSERYSVRPPEHPPGTCLSNSVAMLQQDTFSYLSGLSGELKGLGEYALIEQALELENVNVLWVQGCYSDIVGYSRAFRLGNWPSRFAKFVNYEGEVGNAAQIPAVEVGGDATSDSAILARVDQGMCFLTGIWGGLLSNAERVEIRPERVNGIDVWVLRRLKDSASPGLRGYARCYARDQR